jgi:hypothetical protein
MSMDRQAQGRLYAFVGSLIGMTVGMFMHAQLALSSGPVLLGWLVVSGGIGFVVGRLLWVAQAPIAPERPAPEPAPAAAPGDATGESSQRLIALQTGTTTSTTLKTTRVRALTSPMAPPALDLRLLVDDFAHRARVPLLDGVLAKMKPREIYERAHGEAITKAPKTAKNLRFQFTGYRSEGPVDPAGACPMGWTFVFEDGHLGLTCEVTATPKGFWLLYETRPTFVAVEEGPEWLDPSRLMQCVAAGLPEWRDAEVWLRVDRPSDAFAYVTRPLAIADLDVAGETVRNADVLRVRQAEAAAPRMYPLDAVLGFWRGETTDAAARLEAALEDPAFRDGLRNLEPSALAAAADAVFTHDGPTALAALEAAALEASAIEQQREALLLLAAMPSGLVTPTLLDFAFACEAPEPKALADEVLQQRQAGPRASVTSLLAPLDVLEVREAMGRTASRTVALRSTYRPEDDLLVPLEAFGLQRTRTRRLSGDANLLVAAQFRTTNPEVEAVLLSTPLPVPCHVLHIVGQGGTALAERLEKSPLVYPRRQILEDARSGSLTRVHRAALYVAALRIAEESLASCFADVLARARVDDNVKRALLLALSVQPDRRVDALLAEAAADPEADATVVAFAEELRQGRAHAGGGLDIRSMALDTR